VEGLLIIILYLYIINNEKKYGCPWRHGREANGKIGQGSTFGGITPVEARFGVRETF
jgi:hypothetical protein